MLDLMRLPLGILSGMGFIGAGAILRRGDRVLGITTAATLWFVTVMGLCFGGGQLALGVAVLGLAMAVLWGLKWIETHVDREQRGTLILSTTAQGPSEDEILRPAHGRRFPSAQLRRALFALGAAPPALPVAVERTRHGRPHAGRRPRPAKPPRRGSGSLEADVTSTRAK